eukprot:GFUD01011244.1.p1 GENE.GFUD01011244.1~~GFUD01011244.1.p1  ORF type:complete len:568 (+),score=126.56 GFUD01011244.1:211-1704(+)
MFSAQWKESNEGIERVHVVGVAVDTLRALVDFMYHGELEVSEETAAEIMVAADLLLMGKVKDAICQFMQKIICAANCVFLSKLGDTYSCTELQQSARRFMKRNFEDVCRTEDFLELEIEDVEELISCDNIYVQTEETVVEAILLWCNNEIRKENMEQLFKHVKLMNLSAESFEKLVSNNTLSVTQCLQHNADLTSKPELIVSGSRARGLNKFIVTIAFDSSNVEYLDLDQPEAGWNVLTQCPGMRYGLSGAGLSSLGDTLLVTGGVGRGGILKAVTRFLTFNVRTNIWSEGPPMISARKCHASAVLDGKLYVMGGSDQQMSILTAECVDLTLPEDQWAWRPVTPLPSWHNGSFAPVIHSTIYLPVAYGSDTDKTYEPGRDLWLAWEGELEQRESRDRPGVGVIGENIYILGGASTRLLLNMVERWDGTNWGRVADLNVAREGPGCVGYGGKLYAIGGRGSEGTVEVFDPEEDKWEVLDMKVGCPEQEYSAVILDRVV